MNLHAIPPPFTFRQPSRRAGRRSVAVLLSSLVCLLLLLVRHSLHLSHITRDEDSRFFSDKVNITLCIKKSY
jgi:hypothetical protein